VAGFTNELVDKPRTLDDGRPGGFYLARFRNLEKRSDFARLGFRGRQRYGHDPRPAHTTPGFGEEYKKHVRWPPTWQSRRVKCLKQSPAARRFAYYSSSIGIHQEMGYLGNVLSATIKGYEAI
jgi:hypothetical protein